MERLGSCGHLADAASHQGYAEKEEGAEWYSVCDQTLRRSICVGRTLCRCQCAQEVERRSYFEEILFCN